MKKKLLITAVLAGVVIIIAAVKILLLYFILHHASAAVQAVPQPPTITQVANLLHLTHPTPCTGPNPVTGVVTSGVAWSGHEKIGIDVFANSTVRDQWETMSANFGVTPIDQGNQWVAYKALSQTGGLCD